MRNQCKPFLIAVKTIRAQQILNFFTLIVKWKKQKLIAPTLEAKLLQHKRIFLNPGKKTYKKEKRRF